MEFEGLQFINCRNSYSMGTFLIKAVSEIDLNTENCWASVMG